MIHETENTDLIEEEVNHRDLEHILSIFLSTDGSISLQTMTESLSVSLVQSLLEL